MKKLEKFFNEFIGIENIILIIATLLFLFVCLVIFPSRASAYESMSYSQVATRNGQTYYGYSLPTRLVDPNDNSTNGVYVGIVNRRGNRRFQNFLRYHRYYDIGLETSVWTNDIKSDWLDSTGDASADYMSLSFRPGLNSAGSYTLEESLDSGGLLDYNQLYSYSFYIMVENDYGPELSPNSLIAPVFYTYGDNSGPDFQFRNVWGSTSCNYNIDNVGTVLMNESSNCGIRITQVKTEPGYIVWKYDVRFDNYISQGNFDSFYKFFDDSFVYDSSLQGQRFRFNGPFSAYNTMSNNVFTTANGRIGNYDSSAGLYRKYRFSISQPFNITMWSTENDLYCANKCWTQQDTDNNSFFDYDAYHTEESENIINEIFSMEFLKDFGLFGVVTHIYDTITSMLLNNYNNACYSYNINLFGKDLHIMCGYDFWERQDIRGFYNSVYSLFWIAFIGFWVARGMYLKIVSLFDIENGIVVDTKEVSRL